MMWTVGVDLHKRTAELVALDLETGEILLLGQCPPETCALQKKLEDLEPVVSVIIESVNGSVRIYQQLTAAGYPVKLVPSLVVDQMRIGQRDKTDQADARLLASYGAQLHLGISQEQIWAPEQEIISLRQLTRTRQKLVSQRTGLINLLHGLLQAWGVVLSRGQLNTQAHLEMIRQLALPAEARAAVLALVETLEQLNGLLKQLQQQLRRLARRHPVIKRLVTIPGMGPVLAAVVYAEIGDLGRFGSKAKLRAYAGVVPTLRQSGDYSRNGPLRRACNHHLKGALGQAANVISRQTSGGPLKRYWWKGFGKYQVAMVANMAVARKLLGIIWALWRDETVYVATA